MQSVSLRVYLNVIICYQLSLPLFLFLCLSLRSGLAPLMASFRARSHLSGIFGTWYEYFSSQLTERIVINGTRVWGTNVIKTTQSKAHRTLLYTTLVVKRLRFILIEGINFYEGPVRGKSFIVGSFNAEKTLKTNQDSFFSYKTLFTCKNHIIIAIFKVSIGNIAKALY